MRQQTVAFFHFGHTPVERLAGFAHIGNHRTEQVRDAVVNAQLQHFRIDHDEAHFIGCGFEQNRHNHAVYAYRLARAGHTGYQQVRHFRQIADNRHAGNVFAQCYGELGFGIGEHWRGEDFAQHHFLAFFIRQLDAHGIFAGNGFHHTHRLHRKRTCQILGKIDNLAAFHALRRFDFETGNHRAGSGADHLYFNAEFGKLGFDAFGGLLQRFRVNRAYFAGR